MPLINGIKMACEPCIRGHRSTKCNHANERLMVPVRKPGRPLSACPHLGGQNCGCGSVTAAIPRKQACGCGGSSTPAQGLQGVSQVATPSSTELPSPTKSNFKIHKSSRPSSSRKQSFDPANFERMAMDQINVISTTPTTMSGEYQVASPTQVYGFTPQFPQTQLQYTTVPMLQHPYSGRINNNVLNEYSNGSRTAALEQVMESATESPTAFSAGGMGSYTNKIPFKVVPKAVANTNGSSQISSNGGSCCAPKQNSQSNSVNGSPKSEAQEPKLGRSCCAPKQEPQIPKPEPIHNENNIPQIPHQGLPQNGMDFSSAVWPQYQQPTIFTYPPTYGSWQNPLHPSVWRQNHINEYTQVPLTAPLPLVGPIIPETLDTVHTCSCGDGCECIGCAAHPYNNATQEIVRRAWASMASAGESDIYDGQQRRSISNGHMTAQQPREIVSSPTTHSPSSTASVNGEEQNLNLSEQDFLFVRYNLQEGQDGCFGETQNCPCGDDCECLGCTIHRQPMPCGGSDDTCLCGDECECIGCEIHKGGLNALVA